MHLFPRSLNLFTPSRQTSFEILFSFLATAPWFYLMNWKC